ncbi:MAG: response regulator, partial [Cyanobacteriota bacterium]|nr:response regulator [Cyanobacteriota bacterium]
PAPQPAGETETANGQNGHRAPVPAAPSPPPEPVVPQSHPAPEVPRLNEASNGGFSTFKPPVSRTNSWVLVVDDSITLRQNLTRTLERSGYQVLQARDGLEALKQLQNSQNVSLIICDLEMPKMNGLEFLNAYRQNSRVRHIPVVILTSRQGEKHRQLALGLGASAYLTKPYLEHDLLKTVTEYAIPRPAIA